MGGNLTLDDLTEVLPDLIADAVRSARPVSLPGAITKTTGLVVNVGVTTAEVQLEADEPDVLTEVQMGAAVSPGDRVVILLEENGSATIIGNGTNPGGGSSTDITGLEDRVSELESERIYFNVASDAYGAQGDYNLLDPDSDATAGANRDANDVAFALALADAKAANGYIFVPSGNYCLSTGILKTDRADVGGKAEMWNTIIYLSDSGADGTIGLDVAQTYIDTTGSAVITRQPTWTGFTWHGKWCKGATVAFRYGGALTLQAEMRFRQFLAETGANGVANEQGAIAVLAQNHRMTTRWTGRIDNGTPGVAGNTLTATGVTGASTDTGTLNDTYVGKQVAVGGNVICTILTVAGDGLTATVNGAPHLINTGAAIEILESGSTSVTEACYWGPGTRFVECYTGMCYDRHTGHWSIGYQDHPHVVWRDCARCVVIANGAWVYGANLRWELVTALRTGDLSPFHPDGIGDGPAFPANTGVTDVIGVLVHDVESHVVQGYITSSGGVSTFHATLGALTAEDVGRYISGGPPFPDNVNEDTQITAVDTLANTATVTPAQTFASVGTPRYVVITPKTDIGDPPDGNVDYLADPRPGSRLSGRLDLRFEANDGLSWTTSVTPGRIDVTGMWKTSGGTIDTLTACPKLAPWDIQGTFSHQGPRYMTPAPSEGAWVDLMTFDGDRNTELLCTVAGSSGVAARWTIKGNWALVLQPGTPLRWRERGTGFHYGAVGTRNFPGGSQVTTINNQNSSTDWMSEDPLRGSMQYWLPVPADLPAEFGPTTTITSLDLDVGGSDFYGSFTSSVAANLDLVRDTGAALGPTASMGQIRWRGSSAPGGLTLPAGGIRVVAETAFSNVFPASGASQMHFRVNRGTDALETVVILDANGAAHFGMPISPGGHVTAAGLSIGAAGSLYVGPTAFTDGAPTAAFTVINAGNGNITTQGVITGTGIVNFGSTGQFTVGVNGNVTTSGNITTTGVLNAGGTIGSPVFVVGSAGNLNTSGNVTITGLLAATSTVNFGNAAQMTIGPLGALSTSGGITTTGTGALVIAGTTRLAKTLTMTPQAITTLTNVLTNNNVSVTSSVVVIASGPSNAFTITGFSRSGSTPTNGDYLIVMNITGFNMTVTNADSASAVGNRIRTMTGGSVTTAGSGALIFVYDSTSPGFWNLVGSQL